MTVYSGAFTKNGKAEVLAIGDKPAVALDHRLDLWNHSPRSSSSRTSAVDVPQPAVRDMIRTDTTHGHDARGSVSAVAGAREGARRRRARRAGSAGRLKGSRLVRASKLPATFQIPTTWWEPAKATAERVGKRVRVTIMGASVLLRLSQRVRVLKEAA